MPWRTLSSWRRPRRRTGRGRPAHGPRCTRAGYVLETVFWDAGIARLLPRLQHAAQAGPGTGWDRTSTDTPV